jgi:Na+/H+ antiporter NhaB
MALKCYPLLLGGVLAIEAVVIGMTSPKAVYLETIANFEVILLLMFMVAGIYFPLTSRRINAYLWLRWSFNYVIGCCKTSSRKW